MQGLRDAEVGRSPARAANGTIKTLPNFWQVSFCHLQYLFINVFYDNFSHVSRLLYVNKDFSFPFQFVMLQLVNSYLPYITKSLQNKNQFTVWRIIK